MDIAIGGGPLDQDDIAAALAIGCFASIGRDRLGDRLLAFARRWPGVDLGVHEMPRAELFAGVRAGTLALAIAPGNAQPGLCSAELWSDTAMVAMAATHPLADADCVPPAALLRERLLISRQEHGGEMHRFLAKRIAPLNHLAGELCNLGLPRLMARVAAGDGVSLTCASHAALIGTDVVVRPVDAPGATFPVHAWWRDPAPGQPLADLIAVLRN